ncbi:unnamed protein product [Triticum turgidum subsp. durum]|uniref:Dirigent protein n=1 Tax=Triticum turgidum subsp. durum TaxID=4567 RepID=A0A9R0SAL6_TRITD|nr:unnamed protein product [Triticum turgidum subsp. durum]
MAKGALYIYMMFALALTSCALAGRVLNDHPAAPPLETDPLPGPTDPPVDPEVVPVPAPTAALPLPSNAAGAAGVAPAAGVGATANVGAGDSPLTFFMHDILGTSSQTSALMVTGVVASADGLASGNDVVPYDSLVQSNGNAVNGGYKNTIPSVGRAQGFYVASSQDGSSKTVVLTAMFGGEVHGDTLSFFGVHQLAAPESRIAVIGGTGKYETAKGFAAIRTLHPGDQHAADGVEGLLQFDIHLS